MHYRHKGSHHTPSAQDIELRNQAKLGDHLCDQIDVWRNKQGLPPFTKAHLRTNSRPRFKDDPQQFINHHVIDGLTKAVAPLFANIPKMIADALNKRGDDDDPRQIIADLISDDASPFTPDDMMALQSMSTATLNEMRRKYLKAHKATAVAAIANADHSFGAGIAGADFARDTAVRRARADAYIARNPVHRSNASDDPAIKAMTAHSDMVAFVQSKGKQS